MRRHRAQTQQAGDQHLQQVVAFRLGELGQVPAARPVKDARKNAAIRRGGSPVRYRGCAAELAVRYEPTVLVAVLNEWL